MTVIEQTDKKESIIETENTNKNEHTARTESTSKNEHTIKTERTNKNEHTIETERTNKNEHTIKTEITAKKGHKHRTKLKDRVLPEYTRGEEIFNMVSHIVGAAIGVAIMVLCIIMAALRGNALGVVTSCIYGVSMIALYCMSSIYHGLRPGTAKKVFQIIDHCTIFVLIAGCYTPITLVAIRPLHPAVAWIMFGIVWALAIIGIVFNAIDLEMYKVFSMICYLGMGWCVILFYPQTLEALTINGVILLVIGGVIYTIGAILYGIGAHKRYIHSIFHLFVVGGSIFQFFAILFYALPTR